MSPDLWSEGNTAINIACRLSEFHKRGVTLLGADHKPISYTLETDVYTVDPLDSSDSDSETEVEIYDDDHYICSDVLF